MSLPQDDCPFHVMPTGQEVHVQLGENGPIFTQPAESMCEAHHIHSAMKQIYDQVPQGNI